MPARSLVLDYDGERATFNIEGQRACGDAYDHLPDRTPLSLELRFWRTSR
jgi:hypothetical protein